MRGRDFLKPGDQPALHDLHVIQVVFERQVRMAGPVDGVERLVAGREQEARPVDGVDGLNDDADADLAHQVRGDAQIFRERIEAARALMAVQFGKAGQHVDIARPERRRHVARLFGGPAELRLPAGRRRETRPAVQHVADRNVDDRDREPRHLDRPLPVGRRPVVGKLDLDRPEPGRRSGGRPVEPVALGKQHRDIGGEAGHGGGSARRHGGTVRAAS